MGVVIDLRSHGEEKCIQTVQLTLRKHAISKSFEHEANNLSMLNITDFMFHEGTHAR